MGPFAFTPPRFVGFLAYSCLCIIVLFSAHCWALPEKSPEEMKSQYSDVLPRTAAPVDHPAPGGNVAVAGVPRNDTLHLMSVVKLNETTVVGKLRTTVIEWMVCYSKAIVGVACAFVVVVSLLSIRACVKSQARKRRRRRIRNLADELKTDKAMLLAADSSDEDF